VALLKQLQKRLEVDVRKRDENQKKEDKVYVESIVEPKLPKYRVHAIAPVGGIIRVLTCPGEKGQQGL